MSIHRNIFSILFIFLLFIISLENIFASDEKSLEINIGGGSYIFLREQIQQLYCQQHATKTTYYSMMHVTTDETGEPYSRFSFMNFGPSISFDINFSFDYNHSTKNSIGFNVNTGYVFFYSPNIPIAGSASIGSNGVVARLSLRFKKNKGEEKYFLYEIGALFEYDRYFFTNGNPVLVGSGTESSYNSSGIPYDSYEMEHEDYAYFPISSWAVGPCFSWGISRIRKSFCFEFGGFLSGTYGLIIDLPEPASNKTLPDDYRGHNIVIQAGCFFRFNYNKKIVIKK